MHSSIQFKNPKINSFIESKKKTDDYCKNYFAAQDRIVKKATFGKRLLQSG